jgi:hypothetical protein
MVLIIAGWLTNYAVNYFADKAVIDKGDYILLNLLTERLEAVTNLNNIATDLQEGRITKAEFDKFSEPYVSIITKTRNLEQFYEDSRFMSQSDLADTYREIFGWGLFSPREASPNGIELESVR